MPKELPSAPDSGEQAAEVQLYEVEGIDGIDKETAEALHGLRPAELAGLMAKSLREAQGPAQESLLAALASEESLGFSGGATEINQALRAEWLIRVVRTIAGPDAVIVRKDEDA